MNPLLFLYNELLWRPLFNGLVWLYTALPGHDLGLAIIVLTLLIRLILFPLSYKSQKAQQDLARIQPHMKRIKEEHKRDKQQQSKALMELYAAEQVNPFSGCLMAFIQLPIVIALFQVFRGGLDPATLKYLYPFISNPGTLNPISFGVLNLAHGGYPALPLGILAAVTQYLQARLIMKATPQTGQTGFAQSLSWQTLYIFPVLILVWSWNLPSALTLYWTSANIFAIVQDRITRALHKRRETVGAGGA